MFFKKEDSKFLYGIAIVLMILHHLMGFPNRFSQEIVAVLPFEYQIGVFGKICVGIYAFVTGYALLVNARVTIKENIAFVFNRIIGFYKKFWLVYIIFIPLGVFINKIDAPLNEYLYNFLGIKSTFNGEWWYIKWYVLMMLMFPVIKQVMVWVETITSSKVYVACTVILVFILRYFSPYLALCFVGMLFKRHMLFEKLSVFKINERYPLLLSVVLMGIVIFVRTIKPTTKIDVFLVPVLVFALINIRNAVDFNYRIIEKLGEFSVYIWLTHSFYMYHYFQEVVLLARYSVPAFLVTVLLSLATAFALNTIHKKICDG